MLDDGLRPASVGFRSIANSHAMGGIGADINVCVFAAVFAAVFLLANCIGYGQDSPKKYIDPVLHQEKLIISVDLDGNETAFKFDSIVVSELSKFEDLLRDAEVRAELELVASQQDELKKLLKQAFQDRVDLYSQSIKKKSLENRRQLHRDFEELSAEFTQNLAELLLPHQRRVLERIYERLKFRRIGSKNYFGLLGRENRAFRLSQAEKRRIALKRRTLNAELDERVRNLVPENVAKLLEPLNEQQERMTRSFVNTTECKTNFDLFLTQLEEDECQKWSLKYSRIFDRLVVYFVEPSGCLRNQSKMSRLCQSTDVEQLAPYVQWLESLQGGSWGKRLAISEFQEDRLSEIQSGLFDSIVEICNMVTYSENPVLAVERAHDMQEFHRKKTRESVLGLLTDGQRAQLDEVYVDSAVKRFGLYSELIVGELGRLINITKKQKEEIRGIAKDIRLELRHEATQIEARYFELLLSCLDAGNRQIVARKIGDSMQHIGVNVTQLRLNLSE